VTSPSTLNRLANKTKNPAKAKALRAQAAKMRREIRLSRHPLGKPTTMQRARKNNKLQREETARMHKRLPGLAGLVATERKEITGINSEQTTGWQAVTENPIITSETIERLRSLSRRRDKPMDFEIGLRSALIDAKARGKREQADVTEAYTRQQRDAHNINVVCGFIAEMQAIENATAAGLPPSLIIAGYTVARVVDALRAAGYNADGKKMHGRGYTTEAEATRG
jgi:hypothetical protein